MKGSVVFAIVLVLMLAIDIVQEERMRTIGANVNDIHADMYGVDKALDSKIERNLDVANGDIGFLIDENIKLKAEVATLKTSLLQVAKLSQFQDQFIHDALEDEMGKKDFEKFKKGWANAQVQGR